MNALQTFRVGALALSASLSPFAHADNDCDRPVADWRPRSEVQALAERNGWQVDKLKIDDGCYEIKGRDADGQRFKAKLDPATLEIVKIKRAHHDGDRARQRDGAAPAGDEPGARTRNRSPDALNAGEER